MRFFPLSAFVALALCAQAPQPKHLLAIGDVRGGFQHDSVSHALATIERLGRDSGLYVTYIRTDTELLTKKTITALNGKKNNAKNLDYFDAIFYMGTGEGELTVEQKASFLSFIKIDGKGFIGAHTGDDAFFQWPEFGEMIGGYFDNHPWGQFDATIIVEDSDFPAMKHFPKTFVIHDEIYQHRDFSREKVHVLARLDSSKLDFTKPDIHRSDKDFPVAWAKMYGKGRVFYSSFGHAAETWDDPRVQTMYVEAIRWAMRLTGSDIATK
jgi:type 1 glutamine amidotransferase